MDFLKKFFNDDEEIIGLCKLRKSEPTAPKFINQFKAVNLVYSTNTKDNFFLL